VLCDSPRTLGEDALPLEAPLKLGFLKIRYSRIFKQKKKQKQKQKNVSKQHINGV